MKLLIYFKETFWKYDIDDLIEKLSFDIIKVDSYEDALQQIENIDILILSSESSNIIPMIYQIDKTFFKKKKIIIIRTITSVDIFHFVFNNQKTRQGKLKDIHINNIYMTLNPLLIDDNNKFRYPKEFRQENWKLLKDLNSINNIKQMPLYRVSNKANISKDDFYEKYNLDKTKKIFTIYLTFPKNFICKDDIFNNIIETYLVHNPILLENIIDVISKTHNVVFKCHPLWKMKFNPFEAGDYWYKRCEKRQAVSLDIMKPIIEKYVFIEYCDAHDINLYTDMGMIFTNTCLAYNNYFFDIPCLYVSTIDKYIQEQHKIDLNELYDEEKIFFGKFIDLYDLICDTDNIIDNFIEEFTNAEFKYKDNNILYGNTYNHDIEIWVDYINTIIDNPIK